jgi:protein-L-isoaspartate(D-aspartate) O-methyltransferase
MFMFVPILLLLFGFFLSGLPGWFVFSENAPSANEQVANTSSDKFAAHRQYMVESQIEARGVRNQAVLEALSTVPRHKFVEPYLTELAYEDSALPIGYDQTISQPYIVAYMTEVAEIPPEGKVLEIGTGCGYEAAVLGELAREVYTIEIIPQLADRARRTLKALDYKNVQVKTGDGYQGWPEHAPYDAIVVAAAPDHIPQPLIDQLAMNGKMVIPIGKGYQEIVVLTKKPEGIVEERTIAVRFVPLVRKAAK